MAPLLRLRGCTYTPSFTRAARLVSGWQPSLLLQQLLLHPQPEKPQQPICQRQHAQQQTQPQQRRDGCQQRQQRGQQQQHQRQLACLLLPAVSREDKAVQEKCVAFCTRAKPPGCCLSSKSSSSSQCCGSSSQCCGSSSQCCGSSRRCCSLLEGRRGYSSSCAAAEVTADEAAAAAAVVPNTMTKTAADALQTAAAAKNTFVNLGYNVERPQEFRSALQQLQETLLLLQHSLPSPAAGSAAPSLEAAAAARPEAATREQQQQHQQQHPQQHQQQHPQQHQQQAAAPAAAGLQRVWPMVATLYVDMGLLHHQQGDLAEAAASYRKALRVLQEQQQQAAAAAAGAAGGQGPGKEVEAAAAGPAAAARAEVARKEEKQTEQQQRQKSTSVAALDTALCLSYLGVVEADRGNLGAAEKYLLQSLCRKAALLHDLVLPSCSSPQQQQQSGEQQQQERARGAAACWDTVAAADEVSSRRGGEAAAASVTAADATAAAASTDWEPSLSPEQQQQLYQLPLLPHALYFDTFNSLGGLWLRMQKLRSSLRALLFAERCMYTLLRMYSSSSNCTPTQDSTVGRPCSSTKESSCGVEAAAAPAEQQQQCEQQQYVSPQGEAAAVELKAPRTGHVATLRQPESKTHLTLQLLLEVEAGSSLAAETQALPGQEQVQQQHGGTQQQQQQRLPMMPPQQETKGEQGRQQLKEKERDAASLRVSAAVPSLPCDDQFTAFFSDLRHALSEGRQQEDAAAAATGAPLHGDTEAAMGSAASAARARSFRSKVQQQQRASPIAGLPFYGTMVFYNIAQAYYLLDETQEAQRALLRAQALARLSGDLGLQNRVLLLLRDISNNSGSSSNRSSSSPSSSSVEGTLAPPKAVAAAASSI